MIRFGLKVNFNAEDSESCLSQFLDQYDSRNLVKNSTCS